MKRVELDKKIADAKVVKLDHPDFDNLYRVTFEDRSVDCHAKNEDEARKVALKSILDTEPSVRGFTVEGHDAGSEKTK